MSESFDRRNSEDEADKWFYDLGKLAGTVETNWKRVDAALDKAAVARKRLLVLAIFTMFAFLLLAWRSEVAADRINDAQDRITATQRASCESGLVILVRFNAQQDALIAIERTNPFIDDRVRNARIAAYESVRIEPLPVCGVR